MHLPGWVWSADMLRAYPQSVPELRAHRMVFVKDALRVQRLTNELLGAAIEAAPQLRRLSAGSLVLQSDEPAGVAWPWAELAVGKFGMAQLLRLPNPAGQGAPRRVSCAQINVTSDVLQVRLHAHTRALTYTQTHTHTHTHTHTIGDEQARMLSAALHELCFRTSTRHGQAASVGVLRVLFVFLAHICVADGC